MTGYAVDGADKVSAIHDRNPTVLNHKGVALIWIIRYRSQVILIYVHRCCQRALNKGVHVLTSISQDSLPATLINYECGKVQSDVIDVLPQPPTLGGSVLQAEEFLV